MYSNFYLNTLNTYIVIYGNYVAKSNMTLDLKLKVIDIYYSLYTGI